MGSMSIWHWILVLAVGLLLFGGRGKISELMGDFAKGIKSFKKGLSEDEKPETDDPAKTEPMKTIDHQNQPGATSSTLTGTPSGPVCTLVMRCVSMNFAASRQSSARMALRASFPPIHP